jgi:aspartate dehydrogenase
MIKAGIIGCGTIGGFLAEHIKGIKSIRVAALFDIDENKSLTIKRKTAKKAKILGQPDLVRSCDLIIEAASRDIVASVVSDCSRFKKDVLIMSAGGLLGRRDLIIKARKAGISVYLPSGALCGLDGVKSAGIGKIYEVSLTTRKNPESLRGAPYIKNKRIDLGGIKKEKIIFEGAASDAVKGFPKNVNVAALLSMAGIGSKRTIIRIIADPKFKSNEHEITARGEFGTLRAKTTNMPFKGNPKTSCLAAYSALALLKQITDNVKVGN